MNKSTCDCWWCLYQSWSCINVLDKNGFLNNELKGQITSPEFPFKADRSRTNHFVWVYKAECTHPFCTCELLLLWCCSLHTEFPFIVIHIGLFLATALCKRLLLLCNSMFGNVVSCGLLHRHCVMLYLQHLIQLMEHCLCGNKRKEASLPEFDSWCSSVAAGHNSLNTVVFQIVTVSCGGRSCDATGFSVNTGAGDTHPSVLWGIFDMYFNN